MKRKTAREEFLEKYAAGERNFAGVNLYRIDLSGVVLRDINLCGADLSESYLDDAQLIGADMKGVILTDACLRRALFRNVNMKGACLINAICTQTIFDRVDWQHINALEGVFIETRVRAILERAVLIDANFKGARKGTTDELLDEIMFRRLDCANFIYGMTMPDGTYVEDWDWNIIR